MGETYEQIGRRFGVSRERVRQVLKAAGRFEARQPRPATCSVDGCNEPNRSAGYCSRHYYRKLVHGDPLISINSAAPPTCIDCQREFRDVVKHAGRGRCQACYSRHRLTDPEQKRKHAKCVRNWQQANQRAGQPYYENHWKPYHREWQKRRRAALRTHHDPDAPTATSGA